MSFIVSSPILSVQIACEQTSFSTPTIYMFLKRRLAACVSVTKTLSQIPKEACQLTDSVEMKNIF